MMVLLIVASILGLGIILVFFDGRKARIAYKRNFSRYKEEYLDLGNVLCKYCISFNTCENKCTHETNSTTNFDPISGIHISYDADGCSKNNALGKCIWYKQSDTKITYHSLED
jgi:hypothetical protein